MIPNVIVVIDDDLAVLDLIDQVLSDEGYEVLTFNEAQRAMLSICHEPPALILLDLMMPKMTGWEFIANLRDIQPVDIPIVLLSAQRGLQLTAEKVGAADFLEKPFTLNSLSAVVQRFSP